MNADRKRVLAGGGLVVQFRWHVDRFAHRVWLAESGDSAGPPLLESFEGTPADAWPPSPPLQSLDIQDTLDGRQVALLVGMAGKSHWSASVELDPAAQCIRFDVACRVGAGEHGTLGSRYRIARSHAKYDSHRVVVPAATEGPTHGICICIDDVVEDTVLGTTADESLIIEPRVPPAGESPRTIRWRYTIERIKVRLT